jgi:hypothetical protein
MPVVILQSSAPVQAGVAIGLDRPGLGADDEKRQGGDVVDVAVTRLGDVLFPTGKLPDPLPQPFDLALMVGPGNVAFDGDVVRPHEAR